MKIDFQDEIYVFRNFDLKNFFKIPRTRIKVIYSEFQMGRFLEILHFLTILDFAHVVRVQKNLTKNRGVVSNPDFCARYLKKKF